MSWARLDDGDVCCAITNVSQGALPAPVSTSVVPLRNGIRLANQGSERALWVSHIPSLLTDGGTVAGGADLPFPALYRIDERPLTCRVAPSSIVFCCNVDLAPAWAQRIGRKVSPYRGPMEMPPGAGAGKLLLWR